MKTHVKALVVGGGAVGAGIAYHLAKAGWDTMLLERAELTSGSTWHAAGLLPLFNMGYATTHIHDYSVDFYKSLEAETGLNAGFSVVGNLRMAQTAARYHRYIATACCRYWRQKETHLVAHTTRRMLIDYGAAQVLFAPIEHGS